ncbi:MAG TPA: TIGR02206 family membrane protein [Clostridiaceae bacterium]
MSFFENVPGRYDLEPFSTYHLYALALIVLLTSLIIIYRKSLGQPRIDKIVRISATLVAFGLELTYHISNFVYNTLFIKRLIPLDLCAMALWLSFILCISKKNAVFNILYFWGVGALVSLLFPDISGIGPDKMRFYHYFGVHGYIFLTIVYFIAVHGYTINLKALIKSVAILFPITIVVRFIDLKYMSTIKSNWMFLASPPNINTPLSLLPQSGLSYYFCFVILGITILTLFYIPWIFVNSEPEVKTIETEIQVEQNF